MDNCESVLFGIGITVVALVALVPMCLYTILHELSTSSTIACVQEVFSFVGKQLNTLMDGYDVTFDEVCGIESTLKSNPNTTYYIMTLSPPATNILTLMKENKREIYNIIEKYDNAIVLHIDEESYFGGSPLYDAYTLFKGNCTFSQFAARMNSMFQFGGTTYDSHLLKLQKGSISTLPNLMDTVVVDLKYGLLISEKQRCHAFLFEVGKLLATFLTSKTSCRELALVSLCEEVKPTSSKGSGALKLACAGVTDLPPALLCYINKNDPGCKWGSWQRSTSESAVQCPVTTTGSLS